MFLEKAAQQIIVPIFVVTQDLCNAIPAREKALQGTSLSAWQCRHV